MPKSFQVIFCFEISKYTFLLKFLQFSLHKRVALQMYLLFLLDYYDQEESFSYVKYKVKNYWYCSSFFILPSTIVLQQEISFLLAMSQSQTINNKLVRILEYSRQSSLSSVSSSYLSLVWFMKVLRQVTYIQKLMGSDGEIGLEVAVFIGVQVYGSVQSSSKPCRWWLWTWLILMYLSLAISFLQSQAQSTSTAKLLPIYLFLVQYKGNNLSKVVIELASCRQLPQITGIMQS